MDINEALNEIIFKYNLDRCYPHYRNMYQAERILRDIIREIKQRNKKVFFIGNDKAEKDFIQYLSGDYHDISFLLLNRQDLLPPQLEQIVWEKYDEIYLLSFYGEAYIERWLRIHNIRYKWIYDIFEQGGAFLQRGFLSFCTENLLPLFVKNASRYDSFKAVIQCELYCQRSKYYQMGDCRTKRIALEKCLFLTLYMRNFVEAEKYISLLLKEDRQYECVWKEIQGLLDVIKKAVEARKSKNIILYWLDAIPYGSIDNMPYLQRVMEKSIVFENAFTYIPYTKPTLRALLLGKKDIDDGTYHIDKITKENSPVIQFLEEQGYNIKIYSGYFNACFPQQYQPDCFIPDELWPVSLKLWGMISDLLMEKKKGFYVVHAFDAHFPYLGSRMSDTDYKNDNIRYRSVKQELDEQLAFYDSFTGSDALKFYMSDHGKDTIYKYQVLFNIYHRELDARKVDGLFSLLDFGTILKQLIENGNIQEKEVIREYVEIGNCDRYNRGEIKKIFQNKAALGTYLFGYKGIIDKNYIFIRYRIGKECMHKRTEELLCEPLLFYDCPGDICEPKLLSKYRELTGEYPRKMIENEKFRYTRYLYKLYYNILKHNNMQLRIDIINQMFRNYQAKSIAIRMGGVTSSVFYYILTEENKRKIWGFIDDDKNCLCAKLQLPVIGTDEIGNIQELAVKAIVISSYKYLDMMRREAETWPAYIDVLDIYDLFDKNEIDCREDFHTMRGKDEDYDVGFPYNENV